MPTDEMVKAMLEVFYGPGWRYWPTSSISEGKDRARRALAAAEGVGRVPCAFPQNCGREWCDCPEQQTEPTTPAAPPPAPSERIENIGGVSARELLFALRACGIEEERAARLIRSALDTGGLVLGERLRLYPATIHAPLPAEAEVGAQVREPGE